MIRYTYLCPSNTYVNYFWIGEVISVQLLTGRALCITPDPCSTIENVKAMIQNEVGIPPHMQQLIFAGKKLKDERTLSDYNVLKSPFHVVLRLRKG